MFLNKVKTVSHKLIRNRSPLNIVAFSLQKRYNHTINILSMIQSIPTGVNKIATARAFSADYKSILDDINKNSSVIGITTDDKVTGVLISVKRYQDMMQILEEAEERRLINLVNEARKEYKTGKTETIDDKWFKKMRKLK